MNLQESIGRILREDNNRKERTHYRQYKLGDVIDGSKLDTLSGGLVGNDNNQYVLVQYPLYKFPYTRQDLIDFDPEYEEEEIWRLESIKDNFDKTPPIPQEGDGMHRIIAAKELGYKTILMWKKLTNLEESIRKILREEISNPVNLIKRRLNTVDWLVDFSVKEIQRQYKGNICNAGNPENFLFLVIEKTGDEMYLDYFADLIDENSKEWEEMYEFISIYVEDKFGDELRQHYHTQCGD